MQRNRRRNRVRDRKYLAWIHTLPCLICGLLEREQVTPTEAAHVGLRGLMQKCSDRETIPLCAEHHRTGAQSHHRAGRFFWSIWKLERANAIAVLNQEYDEEKAA